MTRKVFKEVATALSMRTPLVRYNARHIHLRRLGIPCGLIDLSLKLLA